MTLVVAKEVAFDAFLADKVIEALSALFSMEVSAVVALEVADFVVLGLALLLREAEPGGEDEDRADDGSHDPQTAEIFDSHFCSHLNPLLKVDALIQV